MLTQAQIKDVLSYDELTGIFVWKKSRSNRIKNGSIAGYIGNMGYQIIGLFGTDYLAHRIAWKYIYDIDPMIIDHIDGNKLNNKISNLRNVNQQVNMLNVHKCQSNNKHTGLRGATFHKKYSKFVAQICIRGKRKFLGNFITAEEAHEAYLLAKELVQEEACRKALEELK